MPSTPYLVMGEQAVGGAPKRWIGIVLAVVLSGGVGHFYLGLRRRALVWLLAPVALVLALALLTPLLDGNILLFGCMFVIVGVAFVGQIIDLSLLPRIRFERQKLVVTVAYGLAAFALFRGLPIFMRTCMIEAFKIPSGAMAPTLMPFDHVVVGKGSLGNQVPERGDVIVFQYPDRDPDHEPVDYIKRVIGLPGDALETRDGHPIINGWPVPSCLVGDLDLLFFQGESPARGCLYVEFLGEHAYLVWYETGQGIPHEGPYGVEDREVFVLGDNRWNSSDSRAWNYGKGAGVPLENVKGRALSVWLASDASGELDWDRIGSELRSRPRPPSEDQAIVAGVRKCLSSPPSQTRPPT